MTINQYTSEFERQLKLRNNAHSTIATYTGILRIFLFHFKKDPSAITPRMVEDYILTLKSTKYKRQTMQNLFAVADAKIVATIAPRPVHRPQLNCN